MGVCEKFPGSLEEVALAGLVFSAMKEEWWKNGARPAADHFNLATAL